MISVMDPTQIVFYKKYICENALDLSSNSINDIFKFIKYKVDKDFIIVCADGIRINLDELDDNLIYNIFKQIEYKTNSENR